MPDTRAQEEERNSRPWWEQIPGARYNPLFQGGISGAVDNLKNDVEYEVKQLTNPDTAMSRLQSYAVDSVVNNNSLPIVPNQDLKNTLKLGAATATGNAAKAVLEPIGALSIDAEASIDETVDSAYAANGFVPPSQMTEEEKGGDDMRASLVLNAFLMGTAPGLGNAPIIANKLPWLSKALQFGDITKATGAKNLMFRFMAGQGIDEIPSTFLDNNLDGSAVQLPAMLAQMAGNPELAQQIAAMDWVKPGMNRTQSSLAAFLPNLGFSLAAGGGLGLGYKGVESLLGQVQKFIDNPPLRQRALRSQSARTARQEARSTLESEGVIQTDEAGQSTFTEDAFQPSEALTAEEQFRQANGIAQEPTADVAPTPPSLDEAVDPSLPEVDGLVEALEGNVSDAGLDQILEQSKTGSVVEAVDQVATAERSAPLNEDATYEVTGAPLDSVVRNGDLSERFSSVSTAQLESLMRNSPELGALVTRQTGKTPDQFTRTDILNGFKELETEGTAIMPSRLMGSQLLPVDQIEVDPLRFQFKQNVDAVTGQQKGNSLDGVDKYNEDMEGSIQVWEDQMDGKPYVVNGHNRLAKARELGVPSMRVEYINAPTAEAARAKGALTNIAQGGGTSLDAAKFLREQGITAEKQLTELGIPMKSGLAAKGLALSRLPGNIFQDVVDGRLSETKAMALGASGLDETGMQQAYKALQDRDLSDGAFNEVLQQAKSAPTVEGSQVDLFGNTETLNLMVDKAKLANAVRQGFSQQRRAAKSAASNADTLEGVGNQINKEGSLTLADDTAALLERFDADKYMDTATSKLLNQGAEQIAEGGKVKTIANRIRRQLLEAAKNEAAPTRAAEPEVVQPPAVPRKKKIAEIAKMAAQKGEVRPPETPLPQTPDPGPAVTSGRTDVQLLETLDNEARLAEAYSGVDNAVAADRLEAQRESIGYDMMTFEQKKQNGLLDGLENAVTKQGFDPLEGIISNPNERFTLDTKVLGSPKPRYSNYKLEFQDNLDLVAYMIRNKAKASKGEAKYIKALTEQGYDVDAVRRLGDEILKSVKEQVKLANGQKGVEAVSEIEIPRSEIDLKTVKPTAEGGIRASQSMPQASKSDSKYDEAAFRDKYKNALEAAQYDYEAALMDIGLKIPDSVVRMAGMSESLATEMVEGLKEAAKISGLDPLRIQYLDRIDMRKLFGDEDASRALAEWNPNAARFVKENPGDPLADLFEGGTGGVYVPKDYGNVHRHMIYLAMGPSLDKRLTSKAIKKGGGQRLAKTSYHEAFHAVQDWLDMMEAKGVEGAERLNMGMLRGDAVEEMEKLIKNSEFGTYQRNMSISEIQAEAFAVWYNNRKIKLKSAGLQKAFERIKMFINTLRRKLNYALKKDPTWVDVFELAAEGKIADAGNLKIQKLTPQQLEGLKGRMDRNMDQMLPALTDRVQEYLEQKQAQFDVFSEKLADQIDMEGC